MPQKFLVRNRLNGSGQKSTAMLEINNVSKTYKNGAAVTVAINGVTLKVEKGDYVAVNGASGAGKSTLLNMIGGLIKPDSGEVLYYGSNIYKQNNRLTDEYRRNHIGFMFQQFHLMPYLTVFENIKLACYGKPHASGIEDYLEKCRLTGLKNKYPSGLSVGEKQRVAFIRAIISLPDILLADEPTGNLDPDNSRLLLSLIGDYHNNGGTVILVSHDSSLTACSNLQITLDKGVILTSEKI
jgi:putative ABC transport system ATP-binding protein